MNNINYGDFKKICRVCMSNCDINFNKNSVILDIFQKLSDVQFETNNELPEQICPKCFDFINEIHAFSMTCKQTHSVLMKCLNDYKNKGIKQELEITEETNEQINIKDEITIDEQKIALYNNWEINEEMEIKTEEPKIEFVNVEVHNDWETNNALNNDITERTPLLTKNEEGHISEQPSVSEISNNMNRHHYKCDQCEKFFTQPSHLKVHQRVHTGEKPYKCDQCEKSYGQAGKLKIHKRVHSGERPYQCDLCEKAFAATGTLINHKRVHSGERPYQCDQCAKTFAESGTLAKHKRLHDRPYKCDRCEKAFNQLSHLVSHKHLHNYNVN